VPVFSRAPIPAESFSASRSYCQEAMERRSLPVLAARRAPCRITAADFDFFSAGSCRDITGGAGHFLQSEESS
jgi:hypothetical protein